MKLRIEESQFVCVLLPRRTLALRGLCCTLGLFLVSTAYGSGSVSNSEGATLIGSVSASVTSRLPTPSARSTAAISYTTPTTTTTTTTTSSTTLTTTTRPPACASQGFNFVISTSGRTSVSIPLPLPANTDPATDMQSPPAGSSPFYVNSSCGVTQTQRQASIGGSVGELFYSYDAATNTLTVTGVLPCLTAPGVNFFVDYCPVSP